MLPLYASLTQVVRRTHARLDDLDRLAGSWSDPFKMLGLPNSNP